MREILKQIAGDLRAIRRAYEAQVALGAIEHGLKETAELDALEGARPREPFTCDYRRILDALAARGVITREDAQQAKAKIRNGEATW
ncbi:MAG: hypothetical protein PHG74_09180 [Kiritimatiellae bacterium]|nr:hypothetical protein [Kiritimatiellia bacterium]MDD3584174.1 hypothetical protein [Kiritimatiellia bacterium]